jgi:hypothetical protein
MTAASTPRRRRLPLRFSLRVLLLAFTAFAVGFPIWYRWPYEEVDSAASKSPGVKRIITWQRQWGGGRVKHGPESTYRNGELILRMTFRKGVLHGPYESRQRNGFREVGQYADGKKEGLWRSFNRQGTLVIAAHWQNDQLDGRYEIVGPNGARRHLEFERGRLVAVDGREFADQLGRLLADGRINNQHMATAATSPVSLKVEKVPLTELVDYLNRMGEISVFVDPHHVDPNQPIDCDWKDLPLASALDIVASENGLGCDYRYGITWITSAEDAKDWRDPTGVADITPPKDSQLSRSWNEPIRVQAVERPLADVLAEIVQPLAIGIDTSQIASHVEGEGNYPVTRSFYGLPFKHVLGALLYDTRCRCKLDGETLVILPPEAP